MMDARYIHGNRGDYLYMKKFKLFKSIDEKFEDIGFKKIQEDYRGCTYERFNEKCHYTQRLVIGRKASGKHLIQSYDPDLMDKNYTGNIGVGLTGYETKLILQKMKKIGLYSK